MAALRMLSLPNFDLTRLRPGMRAPALPAASFSPLPGIRVWKELSLFTHSANAELPLGRLA